MNKSRHLHFAPLLQQLQQRAERSVVSQFGFRSEALTAYLKASYSQPPGSKGSLLASPVFETMFSWQSATNTMEDLRDNLISSHLVDVLDIPAPFKHQLTAWKHILEDKKSVLVSSGTGSGKTECFMVPILEDLVRQQQQTNSALSGVQAIFLYPLNALINSQQKRLRKWTADFNGDIRFALYNGETKHNHFDVKEDQAEHPEQILSREKLRDTPPSILVTNATMLEYMLVRKSDEPIITNSKGMLKYIVLDEAHSYVGSQAAELSLLLRRVMEAYGVGPGTDNPIQLIATSATIGEDTPEGNQQLAQFLSDLAGTSTDMVKVVRGYRDIPSIDSSMVQTQVSPLDDLESLQSLSSDELYQRLCTYPLTQALRNVFAQQNRPAHTLKELLKVARENDPAVDERSLLALLDLMTYAKPDKGNNKGNKDAFVPLRIHTFMRTVAGLWACANPNCQHKHHLLQDPSWSFGAVYADHRLHCGCGSPVFELLNCSGCGTSYLAAEEHTHDGQARLRPRRLDLDEDEFMLDISDSSDEEGEEVDSGSFDRLLGLGGDEMTLSCSIENSGLMGVTGDDSFIAQLIRPEQSKQKGSVKKAFRCNCCGDVETHLGQLFRYARLGAPFFLGDMIPTLLEFSPLPENKVERQGPFKGRRLLTFTDSRQGTARISARLQQDADRNQVRSLVYHELAKEMGSVVTLDEGTIALLQNSALEMQQMPFTAVIGKSLEAAIIKVTSGASLDDSTREQLSGLKMMLTVEPIKAEALEKLLSSDTSAPAPAASWKKLTEQLVESLDVGDRMRSQMNTLSGLGLSKQQFADFCLYREFGRRPKNTWSVESLGLVAIRYNVIEQIATVPTVWKELLPEPAQQLIEWRNLLKIIVDFYIRENSAVWFENEDYQRWMGAKFPRKTLKGPSVDTKDQNRDLLWPQIRHHRHNRIIKLLLVVFPKIDPEQAIWKDSVNQLLDAAWLAIKPLLRDFESGYQLDIKDQAEFYSPESIWRCPYTRKALDVILLGYSPYLPKQGLNSVVKAEPMIMPTLPGKHWRDASGAETQMPARTNWLETEPSVLKVRADGMWPNRSDRIAVKAPWFRLEEHSAQQKPETNKTNEELFIGGKVNVLNCSTTMEMGVDIGDMSSVAMNNVPPAPANYLQRAGRAGRRGESAAAAVTLCKNTAHGMEVFNNPLWPFNMNSRTPQVRLDSETIVQRHVNAFALGSYLCEHTDDATKLSCQWFFEAGTEPSQSQRFVLWLQNKKQLKSDPWSEGLVRIVKGTRLAHLSRQALLNKVINNIQVSQQYWQSQLDVMLQNRDVLAQDNANWEETPAGKSVLFQLRDYRRAYLFSKLASEAFLPGYGFPVGVVTFNYQTAEELKYKKSEREKTIQADGGKETFSRQFEKLPSRDLPTALREYSPGADVVISGKVYRSGGVMLGKVLSSGKELKDETQHLPWLWFCRECGAGATSVIFPTHCSHCGVNKERLTVQRYLQPIGFATDIRYQTHNDVNRPSYVAYKHPRVLLPNAEWIPLADPSLGRYRFSSKAEIFSFNDGENSEGYAVCLSCGRAESQTQRGRSPTAMKNPERENTHTRLRGGSMGEGDKLCRGHVQNDLMLGYSAQTDVVEIQLRDKAGVFLNDEVAARSLAIALREGLARLLGVENRELGITTQEVKDHQGSKGFSILLFDQTAGGAGYSVQITENWKQVFSLAEQVLNCDCDSACHHCLLGYDSQHFAELLDHHRAAPLVSKSVQQRFNLDPALHYFGEKHSNECESLPLSDRLRLELATGQYSGCGIHLGGNSEEWNLGEWRLMDDLLSFAVGYKGKVKITISASTYEKLDSGSKGQLAGLLSLPVNTSIEVLADNTLSVLNTASSKDAHILAWLESASEVGCSSSMLKAWAGDSGANCTPSEYWGHVGDNVIVRASLPASELPINSRKIELEELQPKLNASDTRISFHHELDCKLDDFGAKFWQFIGKSCPELSNKINDGVPITKITFNDRFLKSPITVRLLGEIVTDLVKVGDTENAELHVSANRLSKDRTPSRVFDDWTDDKDREQVFKTMLEQGYLGPSWNGAIHFFAGDARTVEHARELELHFNDGTIAYVLFDYGLGYWRVDGSGYFNFTDGYDRQADQLANISIKTKAPDNGLHSYMIVGFK